MFAEPMPRLWESSCRKRSRVGGDARCRNRFSDCFSSHSHYEAGVGPKVWPRCEKFAEENRNQSGNNGEDEGDQIGLIGRIGGADRAPSGTKHNKKWNYAKNQSGEPEIEPQRKVIIVRLIEKS